MTKPTDAPKRPPGRPRLATEPVYPFHIRLPASLHDALRREADAAGVSLTQLIIERLRQPLPPGGG